MTPLKHLLAAGLLLALTACSGNTVKNTLGLSRSAPDEFRVVSRPPLSVPPQFSLRPPSYTGESPNQQPSSKQAEALVLGNRHANLAPSAGKTNAASLPVTPRATGAESEFLKNAGADKADPQVRDKLMEEKFAKQEEDDSWWNILSTNPPKKDPLVDARKESERIGRNEDEGKPVTEGDTEIVKDRDTGILGRILGD